MIETIHAHRVRRFQYFHLTRILKLTAFLHANLEIDSVTVEPRTECNIYHDEPVVWHYCDQHNVEICFDAGEHVEG